MQHIEHANASFPSTAKIVIIAPKKEKNEPISLLCNSSTHIIKETT